MPLEKPSVEAIICAIKEGRTVTTHSDGSVEIGPEVPIDPEELARADELASWLDAESDDDPQ